MVESRRAEEGPTNSDDWQAQLQRMVCDLALPILTPAALITRLPPGKKTEDRTAVEVAAYLRDFIDGRGGDWDWDDFESIPITDPELDWIRQEALLAGPPGPDMVKLADLSQRAEALSPSGV